MLCEVAPGALVGMCIIPGSPPVSTPDGGVPEVDAGEPDAPPPVCSFYGQECSVTLPCCGFTSCVNTDYADCTAADPFCFCFSPE
jgi:hypothetical protein